MIIDSKKYSGLCSCGRDHQMFTKKVVIQAGCLQNFEDYMVEVGLTESRAAIYDSNTYNAKGLTRPHATQEIILDAVNLHADEKATSTILEQLNSDIKVLIAVGSGTIHDSTRYCANKLGIPFVSCPTAASMDGFCSTVSAMTWGGYKKTLPGVAPVLVLADINVIRQAPIALALSGVGDVLGKFTSLADWKISHAITGEYFCSVIEDMTRQAVVAVKNCCEQIKENGDPHAFRQLTYGLILSGLAMQMLGNSRPASGAEHHISHFIEMEPTSLKIHNSAFHGEKVGVATAIVSGIYHQLTEIEDISPYVVEFTPLNPITLQSIFQELTDSVMNENQNDCLEAVTPSSIIEHWNEVRTIVAEIPTERDLLDLYTKIRAKRTLSDINVEESLQKELLQFSPCVRNRLTFMRIRRMLRGC